MQIVPDNIKCLEVLVLYMYILKKKKYQEYCNMSTGNDWFSALPNEIQEKVSTSLTGADANALSRTNKDTWRTMLRSMAERKQKYMEYSKTVKPLRQEVHSLLKHLKTLRQDALIGINEPEYDIDSSIYVLRLYAKRIQGQLDLNTYIKAYTIVGDSKEFLKIVSPEEWDDDTGDDIQLFEQFRINIEDFGKLSRAERKMVGTVGHHVLMRSKYNTIYMLLKEFIAMVTRLMDALPKKHKTNFTGRVSNIRGN